MIVQHEQLTDGSRKITYLTEVGDLNQDEIALQDIFRYEIEEVDDDGNVKGEFKAIAKPSFFPLFKKKGVSIDESIFTKDK